MLLKISVIFCICAAFFLKVDSLALADKNDSSEEEKKDILESVKEFVEIVNKHKLNVTVVGSKRTRWSSGSLKEDLNIAMHMPVNEEHLTEPTLTDIEQKEYVKKLTKLAKKEKVSVETRVIKTKDYENGGRLILSEYVKSEDNFKNATAAVLLNYLIKDDKEPVKNVQIMTTQILINDLKISEGFPAEVLEESKKVLQKLWMAVEYESIIAELLVEHLDKKFKNNHQVVIGVEEFDLGEKKFANMEIGDTNVLVFIL